MTFRELVRRARRRYAARRTKPILEGPFHRPVEEEQGWTAKRMESGFVLQPAVRNKPFSITWKSPRHYGFEVHGNAFVLLDRSQSRVGEVRFEAEGPVRLLHTRSELPLGQGSRVTLEASASVAVHLQTDGGFIVDRGVSDPAEGWQVWNGERSLTYLLEEPHSKHGETRLCVVFSAIGAPWDFTYNYRSALTDVDAYRIYILDNFGAQGSYYFADHRDTSIFNAVQGFLREMGDRLGVRPEDITLVGSSKGGTAALAHGLKLGVGRILVGAPQFLPGSYLRGAGPGILTFIAGDDSPESVAWLDKMIPNSIGNSVAQTRITVLVGANDSHLHVHVQPFMAFARAARLEASEMVVDDLSHQDIGRAFAPYASDLLRAADSREVSALVPYRFDRRAGKPGEVQLKLWLPRGELVSVSFETAETVLSSVEKTNQSYFNVSVPSGQDVRAVITRLALVDSEAVGSFRTRWLQAQD